MVKTITNYNTNHKQQQHWKLTNLKYDIDYEYHYLEIKHFISPICFHTVFSLISWRLKRIFYYSIVSSNIFLETHQYKFQ